MTHMLRQALVLLALVCPASSAFAESASPVELRILAINDFHGYLQPFSGGIGITDPADTTKRIAVAAGGSETMATLVRQLREGHANTIFVAAGDLIGASPLLSAMFHNEPTIESLSMMGLQIASVGNHEFDEGIGDGFATLRSGTAPQFGIYDSDALFAYVQASSPLKPAAQNRIARVD